MMIKASLAKEEVQLPWGWWLDLDFRGGVDKRVGWSVVEGKVRTRYWIVLFRDGTRGPVSFGDSEEIA
jgi:hypothetical protein